jgi:hypothetical protein
MVAPQVINPHKKDYVPPKLSLNDQAALDKLNDRLGIKVDPKTGALSSDSGFQVNVDAEGKATVMRDTTVQGSVFEGDEDPVDGSDTGFGSTLLQTEHEAVVSPLEQDRLESESGDLPSDEAVPDPEIEAQPEKSKGLDKREADARKAQSEMMKTKNSLDKTKLEVEARIAEFQDLVQQAEVLKVTGSAFVPPDLNPADEATISEYRRDFPEAVGVMEALVAPVYAALGQIREQVNATAQRLGEHFAKQRSEAVQAEIYKVIPAPRLEQIKSSPEFLDWLTNLPKKKQNYIFAAMDGPASTLDPNDVLEVLKDFSRATGQDIGINAPAPAPQRRDRPAMDTAPVTGTGSALPEAPRAARNNQLRPFTTEEMLQPGFLKTGLSEGSPQEREIFRKRLELSQQLNFDGRSASQLMRN